MIDVRDVPTIQCGVCDLPKPGPGRPVSPGSTVMQCDACRMKAIRASKRGSAEPRPAAGEDQVASIEARVADLERRVEAAVGWMNAHKSRHERETAPVASASVAGSLMARVVTRSIEAPSPDNYVEGESRRWVLGDLDDTTGERERWEEPPRNHSTFGAWLRAWNGAKASGRGWT